MDITLLRRAWNSNAAGVALAGLLSSGVAVLAFWGPIAHGFGAIQWDALNVHFYNLAFSSREVHDGHLPFWSPYIFGGFPQIADLQVGAFYPVNLAIGLVTVFTPQLLLGQLILHYILAGIFAFLFARDLSRNLPFSLGAGLAYAFGGFMVGHASHIGMQNTATWFPLLMLLMRRAIEKRSAIHAVWCGAILGVAILAGHFQTAIYISYALGAYALWNMAWSARADGVRATLRKCGLAAAVYAVAGLIAAVQLLPTWELASQSLRAAITLEFAQTESLDPVSLPALLVPNYQHVSHGELADYTGPWDRTENYLFLSRTILALALAGAVMGMRSSSRRFAIFFVALAGGGLLFALGKYGPLQSWFFAYVPLFDKVRAPANMMLVFNLSVVGLAAIAMQYFGSRLPQHRMRWPLILGSVTTLLIAAELAPAIRRNNLLYEKVWPSTVGRVSTASEAMIRDYATLEAESQFTTFGVPDLGEKNIGQYHRIETFDGYNPLELQRHPVYAAAMAQNSHLIDIAGIKYLPCDVLPGRAALLEHLDRYCVNDRYVPRAFFAANTLTARDDAEALGMILAVGKATTVVLEERLPDTIPFPVPDGEPGRVDIIESHPGYWKLRTANASPGLLFFRQAYYPGWKADVDGNPAHLYRANYIFQAIAVPGGDHTITMEFAPRTLTAGLTLTFTGWLIVALASGYAIRCRRSSARPKTLEAAHR